jgi:DNA mismatch endonuclease (patch repair protein)
MGCKNGHRPKSNLSYWIPKLKKNVERDKQAVEALVEMGWDVLVVWECGTVRLNTLSNKLKRFLDKPIKRSRGSVS